MGPPASRPRCAERAYGRVRRPALPPQPDRPDAAPVQHGPRTLGSRARVAGHVQAGLHESLRVSCETFLTDSGPLKVASPLKTSYRGLTNALQRTRPLLRMLMNMKSSG